MKGIYRSEAGASVVRERYRAALERWPVDGEQLRVPTSHGEVFVMASGPRQAPPVVLLHGAGGNSVQWLGDVAAWSAHARVYAVDIMGEPGLSSASRPPLASGVYAPWLHEVLGALAVSRASFVGESLGGWLAVDYATRHPSRVDRLALLCPSGIGRQKVGVLLAAGLLLPLGFRRTAMRLAVGAALTPSLADEILLVHKHFRPRREKVPVFSDARLSSLTMPVMVTVGARDRMLDSLGTRRRLAALVPHATVTVLPSEGHLLPRQTGPILDFLRTSEQSHA